MAGFISLTEQASILDTFETSFDTWSRNIIVAKEPIKTLVTPAPSTSNNIFGFGDSQQEEIYNISPKSGIFPAIVRYNDIERNPAQNSILSPELLARIYSGPVSIKVRRDCRDYINDGETENIFIDGETYYLNSDERLQTYQGSEYYIFSLRRTK
jgi:hypothetical protein